MTQNTLRFFATLSSLWLLAGCSPDKSEEEASPDVGNVILEDGGIPAETGDNGAAEPASAADETARKGNASSIPQAVQGRWGLVPADCTSTHGDAKGLLEISPTQLLFYESRGTLVRFSEREATRIRGEFSFSGEGMNWRRDMVLDVQDDGTTLIRREYGEDAAPGPLRYKKCSN